MPSRLSSMQLNERLQERELLRRLPTVKTIHANGPWKGYTPDLDHHILDFTYFRECQGLVARPSPNLALGEVLTHDDGWARISLAPTNTYQILGTDAAGADGNVNTVQVRLDQFRRTNTTGAVTGEFDITPIALVAGDGTNPLTFSMWRILPTTGEWARVNWTGAGGAPAASRPAAGRDGLASAPSMPDSCTFPFGAPNRGATYSGAIAEPCFIWTNNVDPVMVYPIATGGTTTFEPLTNQFGADFLAMSCETFGGRVYFLNTSEAGTRYRNRLRRTPKFTANPDTTLATSVGAGYIDFEEFSGNGLRCESLGDVLACYFEDGTAFVSETDVASAPNRAQILERRRGLLGTHALANLGDNRHFGIFTDGWWFLDSSGRWQEAGVGTIGGIEVEKWKKDFYERLDMEQRHRIQVHYEQPKNWIRISFPTTGESEMSEVWIYDLNGDRVWRDRYQVTCWGDYSRQLTSALLWSTTADLWSTIVGSWASLDASFSVSALVHGDIHGLVFGHDPDYITRDGASPSYQLTVMPTDAENPRSLKDSERVSIEYVNVGNSNPQTLTIRNESGSSLSGAQALNQGNPGEVYPAHFYGRLVGEHLGFGASGTGPVMLRSFSFDYFDAGVERR